MSSMADTFEWCRTCALVNIEKPITNYGGECCLLKKKRAYGKLCDYWIRMKETQEQIYRERLKSKN